MASAIDKPAKELRAANAAAAAFDTHAAQVRADLLAEKAKVVAAVAAAEAVFDEARAEAFEKLRLETIRAARAENPDVLDADVVIDDSGLISRMSIFAEGN